MDLTEIKAAARKAQHVLEEIGDDRQQRSDMHGNVDHRPLIGRASKNRHQNQVAGRRDRKECGDSLNDRDDEHLQKSHDPRLS